MSYQTLIKTLCQKAKEIAGAQDWLEEELFFTEARLNKFTDNMVFVHKCLKQIESKKDNFRLKVIGRKQDLTGTEDFPTMFRKLLQGSLEELGESVSQKILDKLKDLQGTSGLTRAAKIKELKALAESELVDLSKLFEQKVESNIADIGIEEKEAKGIAKSLEKLRRIKEDQGNSQSEK